MASLQLTNAYLNDIRSTLMDTDDWGIPIMPYDLMEKDAAWSFNPAKWDVFNPAKWDGSTRRSWADSGWGEGGEFTKKYNNELLMKCYYALEHPTDNNPDVVSLRNFMKNTDTGRAIEKQIREAASYNFFGLNSLGSGETAQTPGSYAYLASKDKTGFLGQYNYGNGRFTAPNTSGNNTGLRFLGAVRSTADMALQHEAGKRYLAFLNNGDNLLEYANTFKNVYSDISKLQGQAPLQPGEVDPVANNFRQLEDAAGILKILDDSIAESRARNVPDNDPTLANYINRRNELWNQTQTGLIAAANSMYDTLKSNDIKAKLKAYMDKDDMHYAFDKDAMENYEKSLEGTTDLKWLDYAQAKIRGEQPEGNQVQSATDEDAFYKKHPEYKRAPTSYWRAQQGSTLSNIPGDWQSIARYALPVLAMGLPLAGGMSMMGGSGGNLLLPTLAIAALAGMYGYGRNQNWFGDAKNGFNSGVDSVADTVWGAADNVKNYFSGQEPASTQNTPAPGASTPQNTNSGTNTDATTTNNAQTDAAGAPAQNPTTPDAPATTPETNVSYAPQASPAQYAAMPPTKPAMPTPKPATNWKPQNNAYYA